MKGKLNKSDNNIQIDYFSLDFFIFVLSIFIFILSVVLLNQTIHPLVIAFSIILSSALIFLYYYFTKKEFKGPLWLFSKLFFTSTICLFLSVIFFAQYDMTQGVNFEEKNISFDVYVINNVIEDKKLNSYLNYNKEVWEKYNISIEYSQIVKKNINLSQEEILFLFGNGNNEEECLNYTIILSKLVDNTENSNIIFLDNNNSKHAGRGSLCGLNFALVSQEKSWISDFTGWNLAHETGHVFGLLDIRYYGRTKFNLMNDEFKGLFSFNSHFLNQHQVDIVVKMINNKNTLNEKEGLSEEAININQ